MTNKDTQQQMIRRLAEIVRMITLDDARSRQLIEALVRDLADPPATPVATSDDIPWLDVEAITEMVTRAYDSDGLSSWTPDAQHSFRHAARQIARDVVRQYEARASATPHIPLAALLAAVDEWSLAFSRRQGPFTPEHRATLPAYDLALSDAVHAYHAGGGVGAAEMSKSRPGVGRIGHESDGSLIFYAPGSTARRYRAVTIESDGSIVLMWSDGTTQGTRLLDTLADPAKPIGASAPDNLVDVYVRAYEEADVRNRTFGAARPVTPEQVVEPCPCCGHTAHNGAKCGVFMANRRKDCQCVAPVARAETAPADDDPEWVDNSPPVTPEQVAEAAEARSENPWPEDNNAEWRDVPAAAATRSSLRSGDRWWCAGRWMIHPTATGPATDGRYADIKCWIKRHDHPARKPQTLGKAQIENSWPGDDNDPEWCAVPAERAELRTLREGDRWWVDDTGPWLTSKDDGATMYEDTLLRWIKRHDHPARKRALSEPRVWHVPSDRINADGTITFLGVPIGPGTRAEFVGPGNSRIMVTGYAEPAADEQTPADGATAKQPAADLKCPTCLHAEHVGAICTSMTRWQDAEDRRCARVCGCVAVVGGQTPPGASSAPATSPADTRVAPSGGDSGREDEIAKADGQYIVVGATAVPVSTLVGTASVAREINRAHAERMAELREMLNDANNFARGLNAGLCEVMEIATQHSERRLSAEQERDELRARIEALTKGGGS